MQLKSILLNYLERYKLDENYFNAEAEKLFSSVDGYIMNNKDIQQYVNEVGGKGISFQDLSEEEKKNLLLKIKNDTFSEVNPQR